MIVCNNCGRRFNSHFELALLVEIERDADDIYIVRFEEFEQTVERYEIFKGCPNCMTDAYLSDVECIGGKGEICNV